MSIKIPFLDLTYVNNALKNEYLNRIERVIDKSSYILGEENELFEKEYADFSTTKHALGVSNGLDAIQLSLLAVSYTHLTLPTTPYV